MDWLRRYLRWLESEDCKLCIREDGVIESWAFHHQLSTLVFFRHALHRRNAAPAKPRPTGRY